MMRRAGVFARRIHMSTAARCREPARKEAATQRRSIATRSRRCFAQRATMMYFLRPPRRCRWRRDRRRHVSQPSSFLAAMVLLLRWPRRGGRQSPSDMRIFGRDLDAPIRLYLSRRIISSLHHDARQDYGDAGAGRDQEFSTAYSTQRQPFHSRNARQFPLPR